MSKIIYPACKCEGIHACLGWPSETMIDLVAHNGEVQEPTYKIGLTLYRINPVGDYALYWSKDRIWEENGRYTNTAVRLNGELQK